MLQQLRKSAGTWMVKALMLLLVASFATWGIGDYLGGGGEQVVAEVGGQEIPTASFQDEYRQRLAAAQRQFGGRLDADQAKAIGLPEEVLKQQINTILLERVAQQMNLRAPDDVVRALILQDPAFTSQEGEFDRLKFQDFLVRSGLSEDMFVDLLRGEVRGQAIARTVTAGELPAPESLTSAVVDYVGTRRRVAYLIVDKQSVPAPEEPAPSELQAYYNAHPDDYTAPELRSVSWISLSPAGLRDRIEISEETLRAAYEDRQDSLNVPPTRTVRQVAAFDEETARAVSEAVAQGASLEAAAQQAGAAPPVALDPLTRADLADLLGDEVATAAFERSEPGILPAMESPLAWHVVEVTEVKDGSAPSFEAAREQLADTLAQEAAIDRLYTLANEVEDLIAGGARLKEIGETIGLPVQSHDGIDASGRDIDGNPVDPVPGLATLRRELWRMEAGGEPETFENDNAEGFTVVQLDAVSPPRLRSFEEVEDRVRADWTDSRRAELAMQEAEALARDISGGTDMQDVAAGSGLAVSEPAPFTRFGDGARLPWGQPMMEKLFAAPAGEVVTGSIANGSAVVARIEEVLPVERNEAAEQLQARLSERWSDGFRQDLTGAFLEGLAGRVGVTINQQELDRAI
ncbi:SurA N-terminal domain-containing protein [Marinibaculum pumilum]|uniref:Parvulin-like PPIase n=1 Tax=Marinibaculum pumilum TaxID=1766165 RepID=A0ABV7KUF2_9PROT